MMSAAHQINEGIQGLNAWLSRIEGKVDETNRIVANIRADGCSKAPQHVDFEARIRVLEKADYRREGRMAVVTGAISLLFSGAVAIISRMWR